MPFGDAEIPGLWDPPLLGTGSQDGLGVCRMYVWYGAPTVAELDMWALKLESAVDVCR